jgi:hypothetical protein
MLDLHYHNLAVLFPAFAVACSRDQMVNAVARLIDRWTHHSSALTDGKGDAAITESTHGDISGEAMWMPTDF